MTQNSITKGNTTALQVTQQLVMEHSGFIGYAFHLYACQHQLCSSHSWSLFISAVELSKLTNIVLNDKSCFLSSSNPILQAAFCLLHTTSTESINICFYHCKDACHLQTGCHHDVICHFCCNVLFTFVKCIWQVLCCVCAAVGCITSIQSNNIQQSIISCYLHYMVTANKEFCFTCIMCNRLDQHNMQGITVCCFILLSCFMNLPCLLNVYN